jgi:spore maturation protein CgeB
LTPGQRLFEAISSGAMVMTDFMWTLPVGYVDGQNIIVYKSLDDLKSKILYYLDPQHENERHQIAYQGWMLAMTQHRTYHRMEQLFFGKALTNTSSFDVVEQWLHQED